MKLSVFVFLIYILHAGVFGKNLPCDGKTCGKRSVPLLNNVRAPLFAEFDTDALNRDLKSYIDTNIDYDIKEVFEKETENIVNQKINQLKTTMLNNFSTEFNYSVQNAEKDISLVSQKIENKFMDLQKDLFRKISNLTADFEKRTDKWKLKISKQNKDEIESFKKEINKITDFNTELMEIKKTQKMISNRVNSIMDCRQDEVSDDGVYFLAMPGGEKVKVYCDTKTDGGGWTVIQRRINGLVSFYRTLNEYENGFGDAKGEYWLGNKHIHALTSKRNYELRIDLEDWEGEKRYVTYSTFSIGNAASNYILTVGGFNGKGGLKDEMVYHNNMQFSTKDRDNDKSSMHCSLKNNAGGGWWYNSCYKANLNGFYHEEKTGSGWNGIAWHSWHGSHYSLKRSRMMIRKI